MNGKNYFVTDGLKPGDKIVVEGVQNLKDGQNITPITPAEQKAKYQQALERPERRQYSATAFK